MVWRPSVIMGSVRAVVVVFSECAMVDVVYEMGCIEVCMPV